MIGRDWNGGERRTGISLFFLIWIRDVVTSTITNTAVILIVILID